jgi:hypothetical protein
MMIMRLSVRQVFIILLFFGLFLLTLRPVADPDFWWHLRTGQLIVQTHSIPHADPFSFTNYGKPWITHEWLSELLICGLYQLGSFSLLIFFFSLAITGAFLLAYLRSPKESKPYVAGFALLLGSIATAPTWGVRPQMISFFNTSLFLYLLDCYQSKRKLKYIIPIPLIMLVWVNLHGGYFLGLASIAIYIVGSLIDLWRVQNQITEKTNLPDLKNIFTLCACLGVSILATLINPNGLHILLYPFQTLNSQAMQQFIQEWFSPDFHQWEWQPLIWFLLAVIGTGMLGKKSISPTKVLLTLFFGYAALHSMRHVPLFVIAAIPVLAEQINLLVKIQPLDKAPSRLIKWIVPILFFLIVIFTGIRYMHLVNGQAKSETSTFPKAAVDWILLNQPQGNLFNSYGWGGYIIWRLYPQYPVYIDGRADVYGDEFILSYVNVYRSQPGWEQVLDTQDVRLVLVEPVSGLASALQQSSLWGIAYEDQASIVFTRK